MAYVVIGNNRGPRGLQGPPGDPLSASGAAQLIEEQDLLTGLDTRAPVVLDDNSEWAFTFTDSSGNAAGGFDRTAQFKLFKAPTFPAQRADRTRVLVTGDSLVRGYTDSTAWPLEDALPAKLATLLPGVEVANLGFGGNTADEVMMRLPALSPHFTPVGGLIPESGSVAVTSNQKIGFVVWRDTSINGTLAGVYGTLLHKTDGSMEFTRASAGAAVAVGAPAEFVVNRGTDYSSWVTIGWFGRNDTTYAVAGPDGTVIDHVVNAHLNMDQWHRAQLKRYLVVSVTNRTNELQGHANYDVVVGINNKLESLFPGRYIDIRSWLVNEAIYELGITPTSADLANMAGDAPPPSIMDSGSHYIKAVAPLIAQRMAKFLKEKGWVL